MQRDTSWASWEARGDVGTSSQSAERLRTAGTHDRHASIYWKYLLAFNSFRFTGILQGIAKRVIDGNNAGNNGYEVGEQAEPVAKLGAQILKEYL